LNITANTPVIASEAKQSIARRKERMDRVVASRLAMTRKFRATQAVGSLAPPLSL
jgi:hypothetical protein